MPAGYEQPPANEYIIGLHDKVVIKTSDGASMESQGILPYMGQPVVAELTVGGAVNAEGKHVDPQTVWMLKLVDRSNPQLQEVTEKLAERNASIGDYMLAAVDERHGGTSVLAVAYIPSGPSSSVVLGKGSYLHWFALGTKVSDRQDNNPLAKIDSIAKNQLMIVPSQDSVAVMGMAAQSSTTVRAISIENMSGSTPENKEMGEATDQRRSYLARAWAQLRGQD